MQVPASTPFHTGSPALILITTLAEYQTEFWLPVCQALQRRGQRVAVLAFDDRSAMNLKAAGVPVERISALASEDPNAASRLADRLALYGISSPNLVFSHERITFRIRDSKALARTFMRYSDAVEAALDRLGATAKGTILVQELGGFLSVIASYYAARRRGIDNWFIEPSFFRGRLTIQRNSFAAARVASLSGAVSTSVENYLTDTLANRSIVIPKKDRHQYRSVFSKAVNFRNLRRLVEKTRDKYVFGMHQDFGHIGTHVRTHLEMLLNSLLTRPLQRPLGGVGRYIYFPFHVPGDMALTLRSPEYLDQFALVEYLLRVAPATHSVVVKEHPAQIGALSARRLKDLTMRYDNLVLVPPHTNNFEVLSRAETVVTVNSKSGAEALLMGKPVVVLGDALYSDSPFVVKVESLAGLAEALQKAMATSAPESALVRRYFQSIYDRSYPGELYISSPENVETFVDGLMKAMDPQRAS